MIKTKNKMKTQKILLSVLMSIFLIASVSAVVVYGDWQDGSNSVEIDYGNSVNFNVEVGTMHPSMTINVKLYDSSDSLVYTFENNKAVNDYSFYKTYTLSQSAYGIVGNYELIISATDIAGSSQSKILSVIVDGTSNPDTLSPDITILGDNPANHQVGTTYTDAGATAWDNVEGDVTSSIIATSNVNANLIGTYTVTYEVTDSAGNIAIATRTVNVVESTVITITSPQNSVEYGNEVTQLLFEISDSDYTICWYSLNGGNTLSAEFTCGSSNTIHDLESKEGTNTWIVYARNSLGYETSASVTFIVDTNDDSDKGYSYKDPTEREYLEQFNPIVLPEIELEPEVTTKGWFARLIEAIVNFFKALFGLD
jgi:hypothetical protein